MAGTGSGDREYYDEDPPRSIFATLWFRAVVVVLVLGVIAAVAVPYVLDVMNPPVPPTPITAKAPGAPASGPTVPPSSTPAAGAPSSGAPPPTAGPASTSPTVVPSQPAPSPAKVAEAPKLAEAPKRAERPTPAPTTKTAPSSSQAASSTQAAPKPAAKVATAPSPKATPSGPYWVQVGAFKDPAAAKRLAERLREQKYQVVEESPRAAASSTPVATPSPAPPADIGPPADRYDVFVSGPAPADISAKLGAKGLTADTVAGGVVVKPSLPLRDAVVLSRDLAADGLKVQVRRSGAAAAPAAPAAAPAPASGGDTFYRVRIGSFPDRPTAQTVLRELEGKGYKAFIARGSE